MTDNRINAAIAEACGWRKEDGVYMWTANGIDCTCDELWDWANDLNAMHEAEKVLCRPMKESDSDRIIGDRMHAYAELIGYAFDATAKERAKAYLKTLGKWKEAQP